MAKTKLGDEKKEVEADVKVAGNNFDKVMGVMKDLNKHYGQEVIKNGDSIHAIRKVPFGEPMLDVISDGGIPIGRVIEFLGQEHSGKTRNSLRALAQFQKYCFCCDTPDALEVVWSVAKDGTPMVDKIKCTTCTTPETRVQAFIDVEGTSDPSFMKNFGVDILGIIYSRPDLPSKVVGIVDTLLRMPQIGLIVLDSVGSMGSDKEVETAIEDDKMNQNALFLNKATRKWQMALNANTNETGKENGTTIIVVNQSYVTLSIYSTEVAQGGRGLRHGKGMSIKTRIREKNKDKDGNTLGVHIVAENMKNKTGMPYRKGEYYLNLDKSDTSVKYCHTNTKLQYIELAIQYGIIVQKGGWFEYKGKKWQGKASVIDDFDKGIEKEVNLKLYGK